MNWPIIWKGTYLKLILNYLRKVIDNVTMGLRWAPENTTDIKIAKKINSCASNVLGIELILMNSGTKNINKAID